MTPFGTKYGKLPLSTKGFRHSRVVNELFVIKKAIVTEEDKIQLPDDMSCKSRLPMHRHSQIPYGLGTFPRVLNEAATSFVEVFAS